MIRLLKIFFRHLFSAQPKHFLILLQNNNELRSTGGFITSVMDLTLGKWRVKKRNLHVNMDLKNHEGQNTPEPIKKMLYQGNHSFWNLRDSNFSPDFNESSKKAIEFYHLDFPSQPVCGLLMLNYTLIEDMVRILGEFKVSDLQINHENLFDTLSAQVSDIDRHDLEALNARKGILSSLMNKLILRSFLRPWRWPQLLMLGSRAFKEKDLQLYDPKRPGKSEFQAKTHEDFLAVIENNYLGLKNNRYIARDVRHNSRLQTSGELETTVAINWRHLGIYNYPLGGQYKAHVRVYIPKAAKIEETSHYDVDNEGDFKVVSIKLLLQPGHELNLKFEYTLPKEFAQDHYEFKFFKQPGVKNESLQKTLTLPITKQFAEGQENVREQVYSESLSPVRQTTSFVIPVRKNTARPRIYAHHIVSPKHVLVKFNEVVAELGQIEVAVKNEPDKKVEIASMKLIEFDKWLLVELKDLPAEEEVFYTVQLEGFKNQNGYLLKPDPRTITVVYRSRHFDYWKNLIKF